MPEEGTRIDQDQTETLMLYMPGGTVIPPAPGNPSTPIPLPPSNSGVVVALTAIPGPFIACQDHSGQAVALAPVDQRIGVMEYNHNLLQQAHDALVIRSAFMEQELSSMKAEHEHLLADFERLRDLAIRHSQITSGHEFRVGTWDGWDYHTWSCKCEFHHKQTVGVCAMCSYQRPSRPK